MNEADLVATNPASQERASKMRLIGEHMNKLKKFPRADVEGFNSLITQIKALLNEVLAEHIDVYALCYAIKIADTENDFPQFIMLAQRLQKTPAASNSQYRAKKNTVQILIDKFLAEPDGSEFVKELLNVAKLLTLEYLSIFPADSFSLKHLHIISKYERNFHAEVAALRTALESNPENLKLKIQLAKALLELAYRKKLGHGHLAPDDEYLLEAKTLLLEAEEIEAQTFENKSSYTITSLLNIAILQTSRSEVIHYAKLLLSIDQMNKIAERALKWAVPVNQDDSTMFTKFTLEDFEPPVLIPEEGTDNKFCKLCGELSELLASGSSADVLKVKMLGILAQMKNLEDLDAKTLGQINALVKRLNGKKPSQALELRTQVRALMLQYNN